MQCPETFRHLNRKGSCGFVWDNKFITLDGNEAPEDLNSRWDWYWHLTITEDALLLFEADFDKQIPAELGWRSRWALDKQRYPMRKEEAVALKRLLKLNKGAA